MFGFKNDLSRSASSGIFDENGDQVDLDTPLDLPGPCRACLLHLHLYQVGLEASEMSTKAIVKRVCAHDKIVSASLIRQALQRYRETAPDWSWGSALALIIDFLRLMLTIPDDLMSWRLNEMLMQPSIGLAGLIGAEM